METEQKLPNLPFGHCINLNVQLCRGCPAAPKRRVKWFGYTVSFTPVKTGNENKSFLHTNRFYINDMSFS